MKEKFKEFKLSSWAIDNRTAVYILTIIITLAGLITYNNLPKEQFPEIKMAQIIVQTVYPGTSPENMENLVTKPIEKQVKNLTGVKKVTSNSFQDYSIVIVEFNTDVLVDKAKQDVKDAVDKAKQDLPQNLPFQPEVKDIDFSEFPIMNVNVSGNYDMNRLKKYADKVKDGIEGLKEIKRVEMVGAPEREIQINVDLFKMQAAGLTFDDIDRTIGMENISMTAGEVSMNNQKRILSVKNEFKASREISNIIVKNQQGKSIYLKDIATVIDTFAEQKSFARLDGKNVITLNVIKASGANLIEASGKIDTLLKNMKLELPKDLDIVTTGEQASATKATLHDLINTIIIGFILVTIILMFFMGVTNALFVALSVPLSCAIAFMVLPPIDFTLNMIVLFAFLLALGIVVDDAIVVIENTHRIYDNGKVPIVKAAKMATGEVFLPVLTGTITTLMPFVPLAFWDGLIGSFMFFLPVTLIITLLASLAVAYVINPVFAVSFMKPEDHAPGTKRSFSRGEKITFIVLGALAAICYLGGAIGMGNFIVFIALFIVLHKFVLSKWIHSFQNKAWPAFREWYTRLLKGALKRPGLVLLITIILLPLSLFLYSVRNVPFVFFPSGEPNFVYVYLNMPIGTDQKRTDEVLQKLETKVYKALDIDLASGKKNPIVKSVISNVTVGAVDPTSGEIGDFPNKGKITVAFVEFGLRDGVSSQKYLDAIRAVVREYPGAQVTVDKEQGGPPLPKPVVIEITGDNLDTLIATSDRLKSFLEKKQVPGVEELRSDFQADKPEIIFDLNRDRMNNESISSMTVAMALRTAVFGKEISRFRDANDDYPIYLRYSSEQRRDVDAIRNMPVIYRDMGMGGQIRTVPISAFADVRYSTTYGGVKRKNEKRIISLSSNVLNGFEPNDVVAAVQNEINNFQAPSGVSLVMSGQQEEQAETGAFLGSAFGISMMLIFLILILQFNSISRTLIIMSEIALSLIGVFLGHAIFANTFSMVMSGIGIVALCGIVVRNGILLVEFMDLKLKEGYSAYDAIVESGRTRMTPVILTATAAVLGLVPLAVGLNIDFSGLFSSFNPHIFFGGDSNAFWAPLAWTMIYGLSFATILTLIVVPAMCLIALRLKERFSKKKEVTKEERGDKRRNGQNRGVVSYLSGPPYKG
ncbi:MAG: efflux transporter permease subunit [Flavipsychrobacter sp.]|jgi:multidrug efflux pump subunit AcrB|nr:efflux transporter permease subunit [Flavipsychrobacter sp.]